MVYLYKAAIEKENSMEPNDVIQALIDLEIDAPRGKLKVNSNLHLIQINRICIINEKSRYQVLEERTIEPQVWNQYLYGKFKDCNWKQKS